MIPLAQAMLGCTVCYGNADSAMVQGANAGIAVLLGVTVSVLISIAATAFFFVRRARRVARQRAGTGPG